MQIKNARFIVSSPEYQKCPKPDFSEFAFIGRSNVGKSSLINMLTDRKNLAKTSNTPGKTQLINHFMINENWYLVDLPGYGFAKISKSIRKKWEGMIQNYLLHRTNLLSTFILIDSRLEPQKIDLEFISWMGEKGKPFALLFTKTDKPSKSQLALNIEKYKNVLLEQWEELPVSILTSAKTSRGKEDILQYIDQVSQM